MKEQLKNAGSLEEQIKVIREELDGHLADMQKLYDAATKEAGVVEFDEETGETPEAYWEIIDEIDFNNEETMEKIYGLED